MEILTAVEVGKKYPEIIAILFDEYRKNILA
jgi:hypothetical protein